MQKTSKLLISSILAIFGLAFLISTAKAQETTASPTKAITVATVNIYDAQIVSQDKNIINISFDLSNRENAQAGIKYSVSLIKVEKNSQTVMDEKVFTEITDLGENETIKKEITYTAPEYLKGKFTVFLTARNESGLTLGLANPGEVTLAGGSDFVEINSVSCFLQVEGEKDSPKYDLRQGVDIKDTEKLLATCTIKNNFPAVMTVTPKIQTLYRSSFGEVVKDNQEPQTAITLKAKESKTITLTLPKALAPQAYDAQLTLLDQANEIVSNKVSFHYVLRGLSATIQNLRLDKDYYAKGDTAKASFFWTPSADNFPGSRLGATENAKMFVNISVKNSEGKECADVLKKELDEKTSNTNYDLPIITDCINPQISISITDVNGKVLAEGVFALTSNNIPVKAEKSETKDSMGLIYKIIVTLIILLLIISVGLIIRKKRSNTLAILLFCLISGVMMFTSGGEARADTFAVGAWPITYDVTITLSSKTYGVGKSVYFNYSESYTGCSNAAGNIIVTGHVVKNGTSFSGTDKYFGDLNASDYKAIAAAGVTNIAGTWDAVFSLKTYETWHGATLSTPLLLGTTVYSTSFEVVDLAVCANPDGTYSRTAPVTGACLVGFPTDVNESTNDWRWTCSTEKFGSRVSCSVNKIVDMTCSDVLVGATTKPSSFVRNDNLGNYCVMSVDFNPGSSFYRDIIIQGAGPWTWTCPGINGGTSANCSTASAPVAVCGNGIIDSGETCENCPADVACDAPITTPPCTTVCTSNCATTCGATKTFTDCNGVASSLVLPACSSPTSSSGSRNWTEVAPWE